MAVSVVLRAATEDDLALQLEVFAGTRRLEVDALGGGAAADAFVAGQWELKRRAARSAHGTVHEEIIVADGRDAGYLLWAVDEAGATRIVDIAVAALWRGVGIGSAALVEFLARADGSGATVSLHVEHGNPARHLYERLGFVEVARDDRVARMERRPVS